MTPRPIPFQSTRRVVWAGLVLGTAGLGAWTMAGTISDGGITALEAIVLALFVPTFTWIVVPFWGAVIGTALLLLRRDPLTLERIPGGAANDARAPGPTGRTAIAVPVHEEVPEEVEARLAAMAADLEAAGAAGAFDVHLLSDTRTEAVARREEAAWARLQGAHPATRFHYRRRDENVGRKAGNLAEFTARCRDDYDFMVVLDADSLMGAGTLVEMVRRMEEDPELGLLQAPPTPARQTTVFGRLIQFSSQLYGPIHSAGLAFWQGAGGNYWGHNAIVRMDAFADEAKLPVLSGRPPLGGEVLSHDFVEAALLRRAGWKVVFDPLLPDSWEEVPTNLEAYGVRDRRWAQGSLQHLRLLGLPGVPMLSRLHMAMGAMAYLSSVLWLLILVAGTAYVFVPSLSAGEALAVSIPRPMTGSLLAGTAIVLFLPKVLGLGLALLHRRREFGGAVRLIPSAVVEFVFSVLVAPLLMLWHTGFVVGIASGRAVGWAPQRRGADGLAWGSAVRRGAVATLVGIVWGGATWTVSPGFFAWMSPIFAGLLLSIPLLRWTGSERWGRRLSAWGLLRTPSELRPTAVQRRMERALASGPGVADELVVDPDAARSPSSPMDPRTGIGVSGLAAHGDVTAESPSGGHMYNAERGLFDLQRGRPLFVDESDEGTSGDAVRGVVIAPVEGLDASRLEELLRLGSSGPARLVVTAYRAHAMQWTDTVPGEGAMGWALPLDADTPASEIVTLASDPLARLNGRRRLVTVATPGERAGLTLAHVGRLLPAVLAIAVDEAPNAELVRALHTGRVLRARRSDVEAFVEAEGTLLERVSDAPVPVPQDEDSHFILFREPHGLREHVAILVGDREQWPDPVPVRLHSACFTGDLFGSLRCDCGEQLRSSMDHFAERGGGILLYLAQEGRGIGLGNKFRAYTIQGSGFDTIDADGTLGFGADERRYDVAVQMLREIGVRRVELLTNNPEKLGALEDAGIEVVRRQPLHGALNRHNLPYMEAKAHRAGHWLHDMLAQPIAGD